MIGFSKRIMLSFLTAPFVLPSPVLEGRKSCGEGAKLICYGSPDGQNQHVDPEDVAYLAALVRRDARKDPNNPPFYIMPANNNFACEEWGLGSEGTVLAVVKHNSARRNSSVLLEDIANTIDGGERATKEQINKSLLGCGDHDGQLAVIVNTSHPAYNTDAYKASKAAPSDLIVKIVRNNPGKK